MVNRDDNAEKGHNMWSETGEESCSFSCFIYRAVYQVENEASDAVTFLVVSVIALVKPHIR